MTSAGSSYEQQLRAAKSFIDGHDDFLVVSHVQPDGDAASSTMAVGWLLHFLNKQYTLINEAGIPGKFAFLWGSGQVRNCTGNGPNAVEGKFSHIITVDCADLSRVGRVAALFADDALILNIDHHPTNDYFGHYQLIDPNAAATAQILHDLADVLEAPWDRALAECIYTGLLTDTGGFRYSNTTPEVMEIASRMLRFGVLSHELAERLLERITLPHILLLQRALNTLRFDAGRRIGSMILTARDIEETQAESEDLEGLVHYPMRIDGVEASLLFKETAERKVKVSLRSAGKIDVARVAQELGGGGHVRAAGATIEQPLEQAVALVLERIGKELP